LEFSFSAEASVTKWEGAFEHHTKTSNIDRTLFFASYSAGSNFFLSSQQANLAERIVRVEVATGEQIETKKSPVTTRGNDCKATSRKDVSFPLCHDFN
jgi:hypothetical protein